MSAEPKSIKAIAAPRPPEVTSEPKSIKATEVPRLPKVTANPKTPKVMSKPKSIKVTADPKLVTVSTYPKQQNPPKIFISGHSHILKVQFDKKLNSLHLNPGAAGNHGFHKVRTMIRFTIDKDQIKDMEVIELAKRG